MSNELMLDVGQANELKMAFRREGSWTNEQIKRFCELRGLLSQVLEVLEGRAEIKPMEYVVDLDAAPFIPNGWTVESHKQGGQWKYDATKVSLYLSEGQKGGKRLVGTKLREELESLPVMNANLLEFYLAHPHLIPEEWKGEYIFFWGTVYRDADGDLYVWCLFWNGERWYWGCRWLEDDWAGYDLAVLLGE
jgi:hypothetical protein